jgi:flagellar hook-length control protein FliK
MLSAAATPTKTAPAAPVKNTAATATATPAKPATAAQSAAEDNAAQGQSFNEVLARQVSDASTDTPQPAKKASAKSAQEIIADLKTEATATPAAPADASSNLPADMLAALLPQGANIANKGTTEASELSEQPEQTASAPEMKGLPNQAAPIIAAPETAGLAKPATAPSPVTQTGLEATAGTPVPSKGGINTARETLADSKKDAVFTSMLATMNANRTDKLSSTDEKTAALAAAPQPNAAAQAALQPAAPAPAIVMPAVVAINTPVTHEKWGDEFNQKITWLANTKEQSAELHLNPPQLGPMDVVLKVSGDQATAMFSSPHAAVREAIEQALPKLREMMAESGIMLGNASVNDQAPRNRQNDADSRSSGSRSGINAISDAAAPSSLGMRVSPISRHNGIVDTFA